MEEGRVMQLNPDEVKVWVAIAFQIINTVATVGVWLYVRYGDRNAEIDARFSALQAGMDERADGHDRRLAQLEGKVSSAPTHQDLAQIYERINAVDRATSEIKGSLGSIDTTLRSLMNRIVEKGLP